jgi:hypothetical protein
MFATLTTYQSLEDKNVFECRESKKVKGNGKVVPVLFFKLSTMP